MRTVPVIAAVIAALCSVQAALAQDSQTTTSGGISTSSSQTMTGFLGGG